LPRGQTSELSETENGALTLQENPGLIIKHRFCSSEVEMSIAQRWYMFFITCFMENTQHPISVDTVSPLELKFLMNSILLQKANIRIKCLLDGKRWSDRYLSVMVVTEKGAVLKDESRDKIFSIPFIQQVMQFVLDKPFDSYYSDQAYAVQVN
jgi:hypothetical protein